MASRGPSATPKLLVATPFHCLLLCFAPCRSFKTFFALFRFFSLLSITRYKCCYHWLLMCMLYDSQLGLCNSLYIFVIQRRMASTDVTLWCRIGAGLKVIPLPLLLGPGCKQYRYESPQSHKFWRRLSFAFYTAKRWQITSELLSRAAFFFSRRDYSSPKRDDLDEFNLVRR